MNGFRKRLSILALTGLLFLGAYWLGRRYSPAIIAHVVEESLIQKTPDEVGPAEAQRRFQIWLDSANPKDKLLKMMDLSKYLEKVQKLTMLELEELLKVG